jgi:protein-disulfide isomerase
VSDRIDRFVNVAFAAAAMIVAVGFMHREFKSGAKTRVQTAGPNPVFVAGWERMAHDGINMGPSSATIHVVEFADLECPACAEWHKFVLKNALSSPDSVAFTMMHFPLPKHRFAKQAAYALECAALQGREATFLDVIYERQDSIGLKSWSSYAADADVPDSVNFANCLGGKSSQRIAQGISWGTRIGVRSTPTVIINGWMLAGPPDSVELAELIAKLRAGKPIGQKDGSP